MSVTEGEVLRHCERCDRESSYLINFLSPHNVPELVCWECGAGGSAQHEV